MHLLDPRDPFQRKFLVCLALKTFLVVGIYRILLSYSCNARKSINTNASPSHGRPRRRKGFVLGSGHRSLLIIRCFLSEDIRTAPISMTRCPLRGDNPVVSTSKATISPVLTMPGDSRFRFISAYHDPVTDPVTVAQNIWDEVNFIVEHGEAFFQDAASQMCWRLLMEPVGRWPMGKDAEESSIEYVAVNRCYASVNFLRQHTG